MPSSNQTSNIYEAVEPRSKPSGLRSIVSSKHHKRNQSAGITLQGRQLNEHDVVRIKPCLPLDQPHTLSQQPLGERHHNMDKIQSTQQPQKVPTKAEDGRPGLHKKTKSSVSLKSLMRDKDKKPDAGSVSSPNEGPVDFKPKKSKSSTNLAAIFSKRSNAGRREADPRGAKDKENTTPPSSAGVAVADYSPIWAQYATQALEDPQGKVHVPSLRQGRTVDEEINLYTPKEHSSQHRALQGYPTPTLRNRPELKPRPMSEHVPSHTSIFTESLEDRVTVAPLKQTKNKDPTARPRPVEDSENRQRNNARPPSSDRPTLGDQKRSSRVLSAFSAFNPKHKEPEQPPSVELQNIEHEFEDLLESRNIPHNLRDKMRSMDTNIKADFIKKNRVESGSSSASGFSFAGTGKMRPSSRSPTKQEDQPPTNGEDSALEGKRSRSRPRSRAFTLTKGDNSPAKKPKGEMSFHGRPKSTDMSRPGSSTSLTASPSLQGMAVNGKPDSTASPGNFIHYLREVQKPEIVEVGKLHKLRILLRNETVAWVDLFISKGGMDEIVGLLYRIIDVEWREEHEDALLHETLLCLKALCTTSLALQQLAKIEAKLFPTLLKMLFDEEKKGPAEFTTRSIMISLLFTRLSSATDSSLQSRAETILSYLRDPAPSEEQKPLDFIQPIYQTRPYRIWCKEVVNVTKEVFWIFLHHLNVVPITSKASVSDDSPATELSYSKLHFPPPRPPVPAAPYVGGVEWDATNYIAAHLDLMNGIIASLPTRAERNNLRNELRASGFEKAMGGSLRTCKEKFYSAVHEGLRTWVAAAVADGWQHKDVREGPPREAYSPKKSSSPKKKDAAPKLELDVGFVKAKKEDEGWL